MDRTIPRAEWASSLKQFTDRNAGRKTSLEEDAPGLGAQSEAQDYPLRGVSFDPRDGRIEIMLGDMASTERHITRAISAPQSVDLLFGPDGRDQALRIRHHDDAQTVLRLKRTD
jgi:hypothetical protein